MSEVVVTSQTNLRNEVRYGAGHLFITDEPVAAGGEDAGPDPAVQRVELSAPVNRGIPERIKVSIGSAK